MQMLPPLCGYVQYASCELILLYCRVFHLASLIILLCPCPVPGAVGHLSFTEILDTSLKVSWSEPSEKNGVLTGMFTPLPNYTCAISRKGRIQQFVQGDVCQRLNERGSTKAERRLEDFAVRCFLTTSFSEPSACSSYGGYT